MNKKAVFIIKFLLSAILLTYIFIKIPVGEIFHAPEGFLLAAGENIKNNSAFEKRHIVDLAPTILNLLDIQIPEKFDGKVMTEIMQ